MRLTCSLVVFGAITAGAFHAPAQAQSEDYSAMMALDENALQRELASRYEAGLAATRDSAIIAADDPRYLWANEAKVQCAIALGYLESSTRDETSIGKCARAFERMQDIPMAPPVAVIAPPAPSMGRPEICTDPIVGTVFFDFDSAMVSPESNPTLDTVSQHVAICGWTALSVVGHTDQAGSDAYNDRLSQERAAAVANALRSRNIGNARIDVAAQGESNPRVPLADGSRSPQNRRVEISAE